MTKLSVDDFRRIALSFPGVEEGTSYGTLAFRFRKKFLARLREDGETIALRIGFDERDILMQMDPATFFITDHYRGYPAVLVRLGSVGEERLRDVLTQAVKFRGKK
ncbi:MAG TPA: MmcQ/YjbR family DNA-binding protein [Thermoanaerobaculia bacterium]|nr:MmcQ/YjbR family DNA-binding protein [Thermoanaerobaculia bacterium]